MSKYEYPPAFEKYCYPDHNPRWNRILPVKPGYVGASLVVGGLATYALQKIVIEPLFMGPLPSTMNRDWERETEQRAKNLRFNPISNHKIGQKVPYDI